MDGFADVMTDRAFVMAAWACALLAATCWILSVITREYSWVDRLWSIAPPAYVAWFASRTGWSDLRLLMMVVLTAMWGARLTYNYARKGGYSRGGEDYRWAELRKRMSPMRFQIFNLLFVSLFQNLLLLAIAAPAAAALHHRQTPLGTLDFVAALAFAVFLLGEIVADEQQWRFQKAKAGRRQRGEPGPEFITSGLFRYSRHPNFFCEQAMWWSLYLFSVAASGRWITPWLAGPVLLSLLFQGSTAFTEELTLSKYPAYANYQRRVSRLWPWFPGAT
jgi:steroid 5-alpha reductase family enzyme